MHGFDRFAPLCKYILLLLRHPQLPATSSRAGTVVSQSWLALTLRIEPASDHGHREGFPLKGSDQTLPTPSPPRHHETCKNFGIFISKLPRLEMAGRETHQHFCYISVQNRNIYIHIYTNEECLPPTVLPSFSPLSRSVCDARRSLAPSKRCCNSSAVISPEIIYILITLIDKALLLAQHRNNSIFYLELKSSEIR